MDNDRPDCWMPELDEPEPNPECEVCGKNPVTDMKKLNLLNICDICIEKLDSLLPKESAWDDMYKILHRLFPHGEEGWSITGQIGAFYVAFIKKYESELKRIPKR